MSIYAVVDEDGLIVNRVVLEALDDWPGDREHLIEETDQPFGIGGTIVAGVYTPLPAPDAPAMSEKVVRSQDLIAQLTPTDAASIRAAVEGSAPLWLLWSALQAQTDPMVITNARFLSGWTALTSVLGVPRMNEIAAALGVDGLLAS